MLFANHVLIENNTDTSKHKENARVVILVYRRSFPRNLLGSPQQFAGTYLYSWVERGTVRVKSLAQDNNTVSRQGSNPDRSLRGRAH